MIRGYARVSTDSQSLQAQVKRLHAAVAEEVWRATASSAERQSQAQLVEARTKSEVRRLDLAESELGVLSSQCLGAIDISGGATVGVYLVRSVAEQTAVSGISGIRIDRGKPHRFMIFGESVISEPALAGGKSRAGLPGLVRGAPILPILRNCASRLIPPCALSLRVLFLPPSVHR
jgi:hypothetical protein